MEVSGDELRAKESPSRWICSAFEVIDGKM